MPLNVNNVNVGEIFVHWQVPEYEKHEKTRRWYIVAGAIAVLLLAYCIWTANFLFAIIILLAGLITAIHDRNEPVMVDFALTSEGVVLGNKFYDYDEIKEFCVLYKPNFDLKNLYFELDNIVYHRLSIPLYDHDPLEIRNLLARYLKENLDRVDPPFSESLAKLLKL